RCLERNAHLHRDRGNIDHVFVSNCLSRRHISGTHSSHFFALFAALSSAAVTVPLLRGHAHAATRSHYFHFRYGRDARDIRNKHVLVRVSAGSVSISGSSVAVLARRLCARTERSRSSQGLW